MRGRTGQVNHVEVVSCLQLNGHSLPQARSIRVPGDRTGLTLDEYSSRTWVGWVWISMHGYGGQKGQRESNEHRLVFFTTSV